MPRSFFRNLPEPPVPNPEIARDLGTFGWTVEDLLLPSAVLLGSRLESNALRFAAWCRRLGVSHAPHLKTHLSPELLGLLQRTGIWGATVATPSQARVVADFGVRRILLANQVIDGPGLTVLAGLLRATPELEITVLVDDPGTARRTGDLWQSLSSTVLPVLVELGAPGKRAGARGVAAGLAVARAAAEHPALTPRGVEVFEGVHPTDRSAGTLTAIGSQLDLAREVLVQGDAAGLFHGDELLFTAGGSFFPDLAAIAGTSLPPLSRPVRTVVRSGCALTHDHGPTADCAPLSITRVRPDEALRPALEVRAWITSVPETGRAIAGFGKRDVSHDLGLPVLLRAVRGDAEVPLSPLTRIVGVNDQHAYLDHDGELRVGDQIAVGPIHACTTFDRWPLIPVLDDADRVTGAVTTSF